jgi:hypothetical protein
MDTLMKMLFQPVRAFRELKHKEKFPWMSLIVLFIVVIIDSILLLPVIIKVQEMTISSMSLPMSDEQIEASMQFLYKIRYLQVVGTLFTQVFMLTVYALLIWFLTVVSKNKLSFQKAFELTVHCYFIIAIGSLINTFLLYAQGIENIDNIYEIALTGLNLLTSTESVGVVFYTFLTLINPFYVGFLVLLTIGLAVMADIKASKAFIISFIFWFILIVIPVVTVYFSQLFLQKRGLM